MNLFIAYLKNQFGRKLTVPIFGVGITLIIIALFIGISDNPPGVGLAYLGISFLCFSMIHQWRSARDYWTLLAISVISFPVLILLHNIFDTVNTQIGTMPLGNQFLNGFAVIFFVGGVLIAPAVALVGIVGGLYYLIFKQHPN
ncbi:MAG: hypothetical protein HQ506_07125 [Candidatus Marinimicrobia bacterium]|nr:hypothetical protein [Candidatus Neomarinimicrobiota bacterium]